MLNVSTTAVSKRGRAVIPAEIRNRHLIATGCRLAWLDDGQRIVVVPVPAEPLRALRGRGRGEGLVEALLAARRVDRELERSA